MEDPGWVWFNTLGVQNLSLKLFLFDLLQSVQNALPHILKPLEHLPPLDVLFAALDIAVHMEDPTSLSESLTRRPPAAAGLRYETQVYPVSNVVRAHLSVVSLQHSAPLRHAQVVQVEPESRHTGGVPLAGDHTVGLGVNQVGQGEVANSGK